MPFHHTTLPAIMLGTTAQWSQYEQEPKQYNQDQTGQTVLLSRVALNKKFQKHTETNTQMTTIRRQ